MTYSTAAAEYHDTDYASASLHPLVGSGVTKTITGKKSSADFQSEDLMLAACPSKREKCGARNIVIDTFKSAPVDLNIHEFMPEDSCHWLIKAKCGLPSINISDMTDGVMDELAIHFLEWEQGVVEV